MPRDQWCDTTGLKRVDNIDGAPVSADLLANLTELSGGHEDVMPGATAAGYGDGAQVAAAQAAAAAQDQIAVQQARVAAEAATANNQVNSAPTKSSAGDAAAAAQAAQAAQAARAARGSSSVSGARTASKPAAVEPAPTAKHPDMDMILYDEMTDEQIQMAQTAHITKMSDDDLAKTYKIVHIGFDIGQSKYYATLAIAARRGHHHGTSNATLSGLEYTQEGKENKLPAKMFEHLFPGGSDVSANVRIMKIMVDRTAKKNTVVYSKIHEDRTNGCPVTVKISNVVGTDDKTVVGMNIPGLHHGNTIKETKACVKDAQGNMEMEDFTATIRSGVGHKRAIYAAYTDPEHNLLDMYYGNIEDPADDFGVSNKYRTGTEAHMSLTSTAMIYFISKLPEALKHFNKPLMWWTNAGVVTTITERCTENGLCFREIKEKNPIYGTILTELRPHARELYFSSRMGGDGPRFVVPLALAEWMYEQFMKEVYSRIPRLNPDNFDIYLKNVTPNTPDGEIGFDIHTAVHQSCQIAIVATATVDYDK